MFCTWPGSSSCTQLVKRWARCRVEGRHHRSSGLDSTYGACLQGVHWADPGESESELIPLSKNRELAKYKQHILLAEYQEAINRPI